MSQNQFFPSIGHLAGKADGVSDVISTSEDVPDDGSKPLEEVESLCMQCGEQGITRMLLTSIPFFKEVIVMSFRCEHCGATNNEIQSAGTIRPEGVSYTVKALHQGDLNRQIVRSEACTIEIPELELQLPPMRGQLTTVEGLLCEIAADLNLDQPLRRIQDVTAYKKIQGIIDNLKQALDDEEDENDSEEAESKNTGVEKHPDDSLKKVLTVKLDDPSGNSFIEFLSSMADPKWSFKSYARTEAQNRTLGLLPPQETPKESEEEGVEGKEVDGDGVERNNEEVFEFPGVCSRCGHALVTRMKKVSIPYFKDTLIMSTNCDACGYRDNEIKSGSAISEKGKKITLKVEDREDLSRDILKSETSGLIIPEIDLVLQPGTLGGRFTTLEGILDQVYEELSEKVFTTGDSSVIGHEDRENFQKFLGDLKEIKNAEKPFTLILDDPLANSHVQNLYAPDPDPNMEIITYERTWQQNEDLGLNDMNVESYSGTP